MKTKRICAFLLSLCMFFSLAQFAGAEDEAFELNPLATVTPITGTVGVVKTGDLVFSDKTSVFNSNLPQWLDGKTFLQITIANGVSKLPVAKAGWVYVLTPSTASESSSTQEASLENAGFTNVATLASKALSTGLKEELSVMGKEVNAGETISFKKWGVLITEVAETDNVEALDPFGWKSSLGYQKEVTVNSPGDINSNSVLSDLVDGDESTYLRLNKAAIGSDRWVWYQVDLGSTKAVDYFKIMTHQLYSASMYKANSFIEALKIEGSVNNNDFFPIIAETSHSSGIYPSEEVFEFTADKKYDARYVRISLKIQETPTTGTSDEKKTRVPSLKEFGIYNKTPDYVVAVHNYKIKNGESYIPAKGLASGEMKITTNVLFGDKYDGKDIIIFVAVYDEEGLKNVSNINIAEPIRIEKGIQQTINTVIDIEDAENSYLKVFVWENNFTPLTNSGILESVTIAQ